MVTITLVYKDTTTWFAGAFNSIIEANAWSDKEQASPYWDKATQIQITDTTTADKAKADASAAALTSKTQALVAKKAAIVAAQAKPSATRTVIEANALIDGLVDYIVTAGL